MTMILWNTLILGGVLLIGLAGLIAFLRKKGLLSAALLLVGASLMAIAPVLGLVAEVMNRLGANSSMGLWPHRLLTLASACGVLIVGLGTLLVSLSSSEK